MEQLGQADMDHTQRQVSFTSRFPFSLEFSLNYLGYVQNFFFISLFL